MTTETPLANRPAGRMNGGRAMAEMLRLAGAGPMFGMGGFQLLPFYDAVGQLGLRHHLINDERCGAFAADAYARVTNRPGICDATLGPGATNLVTGLVESLNAGTPMVAFAGDANRAHRRCALGVADRAPLGAQRGCRALRRGCGDVRAGIRPRGDCRAQMTLQCCRTDRAASIVM
jgi:hypothetical protein